MLKRSIDVCLVVVLLPITLFFLAIACVMTLSSSCGPIFYSQRRLGKNGEHFRIWKIRTMYMNSGEILEEYLALCSEARVEWLESQKLRRDPRITPIGSLLRKYSIDELPQLWNVLIGDMSIVGPRPIVDAEVKKYGDFFKHYCQVKPGLTGLWQVSGRSMLSYEMRVSLDCEYVESWSISRDLKIIARTLPAVFNQNGAF